MIRTSIFIILLLILSDLNAQQPLYRNYTADDGLPSNNVYDMLHDNDRNLWFATDQGVCKYDGYEFKTYTTRDGLDANSIIKLYAYPCSSPSQFHL